LLWILGYSIPVAKKFRVISTLIFAFYRVLKEGTLAENAVLDGGKITLLPNVESGLAVS
jgi:hypothetical protein